MPVSKAKQAEVAAKRVKAVEMRLAGATWDQIAQTLGYSSRAAAYNAVRSGMERDLRTFQDRAEVLRQTELERLDRLQRGLWMSAIGGDTKSADTVLRIIDRRIRLLGLDIQPDLDEQTRVQLTRQVAERMYVVFARVLDQLGLTAEQRAMVPGLLQAAVAGFSGSESPAGSARQLRQIEGTVIDDEGSVQSG